MTSTTYDKLIAELKEAALNCDTDTVRRLCDQLYALRQEALKLHACDEETEEIMYSYYLAQS